MLLHHFYLLRILQRQAGPGLEVSSHDSALVQVIFAAPQTTHASWRECGSSEVGSGKIPLLKSLPNAPAFLSDQSPLQKPR